VLHFERWSLLIIGEALLRDVTRVSDFERNLLIDRATLGARIDGLVNAGLMDRVVEGDQLADSRYVLTDKGRDLEQVVREVDLWSERWLLPVPTPAELTMASPNGDRQQHPTDADVAPIELSLLGAFRLRVSGKQVPGLLPGSQRLLAFLAVHHRPMSRVAVAGRMWPESSHERAGVSLRSALARLEPATRDAIILASAGLALGDTVTVDLHAAHDLAHRLLLGDEAVTDDDLSSASVDMLALELLPDWHDEWIATDADDWRELRSTALEAASHLLATRNQPLEAARAARAAIKVEPLRESAHGALIHALLMHGNRSEALRAYERYRELLGDALDIEPTKELSDMVSGLRRP
jgi:DNA-binding SARP family transcriptional activator/DNA-binding HxlR family transcriptional regulator